MLHKLIRVVSMLLFMQYYNSAAARLAGCKNGEHGRNTLESASVSLVKLRCCDFQPNNSAHFKITAQQQPTH